MLTAADIRNKLFRVVRLRAGYEQTQVDEFLDRAEASVTSRVARCESAAAPGGLTDESAELTVTLTAADIPSQTFDIVRLREGYERSDVDDFLRELASGLDQLDADLRRYGVRVKVQSPAR